ncbi:S-adenosyl-L-methionine-dependent methyltransferase [Lentinula boryana]|uniref:S-adenosyl-L-methionine-dependent methyltransferase n=1 Tax=Lentinula boryana TaxID=40481 RepID=A0ABQ8QCD6_9AGAR|nr:S-adenosyl-L-methionine-dependent methyltransferase [Lentinula boryana]
MSSFDNTHITALTDLINKAVQDIIAEYAAAGRAVPSLDTLESGLFQVPEETPARLTKAIQIVEAACAQLSCTVAPPGSVMINKSLEHEEPACLLVVTEARIADLLLDKPEGLPVSELASHSGLDTRKLTRILRLLATKHCFKEVKPGVFANNRLSMKLLSSDTVSSIVCLLTDESLRASAYLNETLTDPSEMDGGIPFIRATGYPFFDYHKTGSRKGNASQGPWLGGNGHATMNLMKAHPHIKVVLQDQPQVIDMAQKFWAKEYPAAMEKERIQFIPFDFFKDAAVQGCDFYYIRSILRDWPDTESELILKNVRQAMKQGSRVIIHDTVLRDAVRTPESSSDASVRRDVAPEPLLPNYGVARVRTYELDMAMMNLLNSQMRTLPEFIELG